MYRFFIFVYNYDQFVSIACLLKSALCIASSALNYRLCVHRASMRAQSSPGRVLGNLAPGDGIGQCYPAGKDARLIHPCRMEQIDSVKINPSLVMMRECFMLPRTMALMERLGTSQWKQRAPIRKMILMQIFKLLVLWLDISQSCRFRYTRKELERNGRRAWKRRFGRTEGEWKICVPGKAYSIHNTRPPFELWEQFFIHRRKF